MTHSRDLVILSFFSMSIGKRSKVDRSSSYFGRCLEVMELQGHVQSCTCITMKSWLAFHVPLTGSSPQSMGDNNAHRRKDRNRV